MQVNYGNSTKHGGHVLTPLIDTLSRLSVAEADFREVAKDECLGETQAELRANIMTLLSTPSARFIFLRGSPGTSKTAISKRVAMELHSQKRLAASFFFDGSGARKGAASLKMFVSTLASQLAEYFPPFRTQLASALRETPGILRGRPEDQLKALILDPLRGAQLGPFNLPAVIVLDGLDECGNPCVLGDLMDLVTALTSLPQNILVLVSCRPEKLVLQSWKHCMDSPIVFDTNSNPDQTKADIREYVRMHLDDVIYESTLGDDEDGFDEPRWYPDPEDIEDFVEFCGGIFQIASLRIRELRQGCTNSTVRDTFTQLLLEAKEASTYELVYLSMLRRAYPMGESTLAVERFRKVMCGIVGSNPCLPLGLGALAVLLGVEPDSVRATLKPLSSVIEIGGRGGDEIRIMHASFKDFLMGQPCGTREQQDWFFFTKEQNDSFLSACCLNYLEAQLQTHSTSELFFALDNNPANLPPLVQPAFMLSTSEIAHSQALQYACDFWGPHFVPESAAPSTWKALQRFIEKAARLWLDLMAERDRAAGDEDLPCLCIANCTFEFIMNEYEVSDCPVHQRLSTSLTF